MVHVLIRDCHGMYIIHTYITKYTYLSNTFKRIYLQFEAFHCNEMVTFSLTYKKGSECNRFLLELVIA